jgi:hypothetical protein
MEIPLEPLEASLSVRPERDDAWPRQQLRVAASNAGAAEERMAR